MPASQPSRLPVAVPGVKSSSLRQTPERLSRKSPAADRSPPDGLRQQIDNTCYDGSQAEQDDTASMRSTLNEILREQKDMSMRVNSIFQEISLKLESVMAENRSLREKLTKFEVRVEEMERTFRTRDDDPAYRTRSAVQSNAPRGNAWQTAGSHSATQLAEVIAEEVERVKRSENLILRGIPEADNEDSVALSSRCEQLLQISADQILSAERIGSASKAVQGKARPVRLRMKSHEAKLSVYRKRLDLKLNDQDVYVNNDLTKQQQIARRQALPRYKELRQKEIRCSLPYGEILNPDGTPYSATEIDELATQ